MALGDTARLVASLELQDKFSRPAGQIQMSLGRLEGSFDRIQRGAGQVGSGLYTLGTVAAVAAVGGLTAVITTAATMEEAFTGVKKTVDETVSTSFEDLRLALRQMSSDTGTAFEELSRIGEIGGALGIGIESLDEFIDVVNRLSVSTDLTAETASTALGQLGTILHLEGEEFRSFADTLVALGNAGASTEPQIVDLAARFAAAGNSAGLSTQEILALASAVSSMGVEVEAGGTALSQTFSNVTIAIATGGKEVEAFTETLGISAAEFKRRWSQDALGTFQEFLGVVGELDQFGQADILSRAGITGVRQLRAVSLMAQNVGFLAEQLEIAENATGALGEESDKFFGTSAAQFRRLRENVRLTADTIGTELLPVANELITEFVEKLSQPETQASIKQFAEDLAGGIRGFVDELRGTDFSGLLNGIKLAAQVAKDAFDLFNQLPPDIKALAIGALVVNKATGGAVGNIAQGLVNILGGLGGGLLGRGSSPLNAVWVRQVGGIGGQTGGGSGGLLAGFVGTAAILATISGGLLAIEKIASGNEEEVKQGIGAAMTGFPGMIGLAVSEALKGVFPDIFGGGGALVGDPFAKSGPFIDTWAKLREGGVEPLPDTAFSALDATADNTSVLPPILTKQERMAQTQASLLQAQAAANVKLQQISSKDMSPDVNVTTSQNVYIDGRTVAATVSRTIVDTFTRQREG